MVSDSARKIPDRVVSLVPSLGRDNDHEILATVRAIGAALRSAKLDWFDLAQACAASKPSPATVLRHGSPSPQKRSASFGDLARACRDLDRGLSPSERTFVADMVRRGFAFHPSPRQADWLASIFDRLQGRAAA